MLTVRTRNVFSAEQMLRCVETTPFLSQLPHLEVTEARMTHCEAAHKLVANCSSLQPSLTCQLCVMPLDACGRKINEFGKPCQQLAAVMNIARYCEGGAFRQNWHEPAVDYMRGGLLAAARMHKEPTVTRFWVTCHVFHSCRLEPSRTLNMCACEYF